MTELEYVIKHGGLAPKRLLKQITRRGFGASVLEMCIRDRYVIGLFGTGRRYINEVMLQSIGERAKYFRDTIRLHPGPTPMIYSGHATMKHASRLQYQPVVTSRIVEAVRSGSVSYTHLDVYKRQFWRTVKSGPSPQVHFF